MGTGSTGIAAANTGRRFIGIEKDEGFFRIAMELLRTAGRTSA
jgi:site-specific DNA-methyltransferase (adenine-specific)